MARTRQSHRTVTWRRRAHLARSRVTVASAWPWSCAVITYPTARTPTMSRTAVSQSSHVVVTSLSGCPCRSLYCRKHKQFGDWQSESFWTYSILHVCRFLVNVLFWSNVYGFVHTRFGWRSRAIFTIRRLPAELTIFSLRHVRARSAYVFQRAVCRQVACLWRTTRL